MSKVIELSKKHPLVENKLLGLREIINRKKTIAGYYEYLFSNSISLPLTAWDYPVDEITWDEIVAIFGADENNTSKIKSFYSLEEANNAIANIQKYAQSKLAFLQERIDKILNNSKFNELKDVSEVEEIIQLISAISYYPITYSETTYDRLYSPVVFCMQTAKNINKSIDEGRGHPRQIFISINSIYFSLSGFCVTASDILKTEFEKYNCDVKIIRLPPKLPVNISNEQDDIKYYYYTYHFYLILKHKTGYYIIDPTWQQMIYKDSRHWVNPNTMVIYFNGEADFEEKIRSFFKPYDMAEEYTLEAYYLDPMRKEFNLKNAEDKLLAYSKD